MKEHPTIFSIKELKNKVKNAFVNGIPNRNEKIKLIENWQANIISGKVTNAKEEEIKPLFLTLFFGDVLGYEYKNATDWNLRLENKSSYDSSKADAALGFFSIKDKQEIDKDVRVVIEIKDARTTLDKPQNRADFKGSPVEQCFMYAAKSGGKCKWVVVSNFLEIRLYLASDMTKYESFDILSLHDNYEFSKFYYLLANGQLFYSNIASTIDNFLADRQEKEKTITKEFYEQYQYLREVFLQHLKLHNPDKNPLDLLQYAQTIIDRIIFICVIKDYDLISIDTIKKILWVAEESFAHDNEEIWRQLKNLFVAFDLGYRNRLYKFNGGLFRQSQEINSLKIKDVLLKQVLTLNNYDFESDLNVNVLGHIFEQSISDIETLKKEISANNSVEYAETDDEIVFKNNRIDTNKRKKDGIYYTPENITQYIVNVSIGTWLNERKDEIGINQMNDYPKTEEDRKQQIELWGKYAETLKKIKILDPACGSGAFLTQAFDFLLKEWTIVIDIIDKLENEKYELKNNGIFANEITKNQRTIAQVKKDIVNNNLYGVDLNTESIEITKLGLWLKSATKNDPLALLDENIKCGNSLISDVSISEKAFDWENEFSEIMKLGGFDVIIGNPPYVVIKGGRFLEGYQYTDDEINYIKENYQTAQQQINTYTLFVEKSIELMNKTSFVSFIIPNTFLANEYSQRFREHLLEKTQIVDIYNVGIVFEDANVETLILTLNHEKLKKTKIKIANKETLIDLAFVSKITEDKKFLLNIDDTSLKIIQKLNSFPKLSSFAKVWRGLTTGNDKKYLVETQTDEKHKELITGKEIQRYYLRPSNLFVYYDKDLLDRARDERIFLQSEKLISKFVGTSLTFCYDNQQYYVLNTGCVTELIDNEINIKYLLALLNSKLLDFYFRTVFSDYRETFPIMKSGNIENLPIPKISISEQQTFVELVDKMLEYHKQVNNLKNNFIELVKSELKVRKITNKLEDWYIGSWDEFSDELKKLKVKLGMEAFSDWKQFYTREKAKVQPLLKQIAFTDNEINRQVYKLYHLDNADIQYIEK